MIRAEEGEAAHRQPLTLAKSSEAATARQVDFRPTLSYDAHEL